MARSPNLFTVEIAAGMGLRSLLRKLRRRSDRTSALREAGIRTLHEDFEAVVSKRAGAPPGGTDVVDLGGAGRFDVGIVGESNYADELRAIRGQLPPAADELEFTVILQREPENQYDSNAVKVLSEGGNPIGYLSREAAVIYRPVFLALEATSRMAGCRAKMFGGTPQKPNIGVWIDIYTAEELLARPPGMPRSNRPPERLQRGPAVAKDDLDAHGQPFNVRFNRARRSERDLSEFLGLAKGLLADGIVTDVEARHVREWVRSHPDAAEQWPMPALISRLDRIFADGKVDEDERRDLAELLGAIVGGTAGVIVGTDAPTELPVDVPPPTFVWSGSVFVFTGKFAYGTRAHCEREVVARGGSCNDQITKKTNYLVIGTFGSRDWVQTSFGRKIQKAVEYRRKGQRLFIVSEDHWGAAIATGEREE